MTEAFLPKVDGVSKTTYLTVRYLQETGREVLIFAPDTSIPHVGESEVVPLPSFSMPAAEETRVALPNPVVARRISEFQPDLIHLCSPAGFSVSGMAMGRHLNIPVVANYQTDLPGYAAHYGAHLLEAPTRLWLRYLHNGCHINLVPTSKTKAELETHGYKRLRVWGRGVNIERFHPNKATPEMRQRLLNGRDPDSLIVIYVGRLANEKRVDLLHEVAKLPGVSLTIVGDGARREELETLFSDTDTHFTGYLFGDELSQAFASADVFIFPGPQETFGQVVQEAMASGLPSVVTCKGGVSAVNIDGVTGITVAHNTAAFAQAVQTLVENPDMRRTMATNARAEAERRPWSALMSQLETYYHEAVNLNNRFVQRFGGTTYHIPLSLPARFQWALRNNQPVRHKPAG